MVENALAGAELGEREHVCVLHRGPAEREALLGALVGDGLAAGARCLFVTEEAEAARLAGRFPVGDDLTLLPVTAYLTRGKFQPAKAAAQWDAMLGAYVTAGCRHVRAGGALSWWPGRPERWSALLDYEARCDELVQRHPTTFFCFYDLEQFGGQALPGLLGRHPTTLARQVLFRSGEQERRWGLDGPGAEAERLALAALLLSGASSEDEVADLVAGVSLAALPLDFAALVLAQPGGHWRARGLAGHGPLDARLAARLTAIAGRTGGVPVASDGGFVAVALPVGGGSLVLGAPGALDRPEAARFAQALAVLAGGHVAAASRPARVGDGATLSAGEVGRDLLDGGGDEDAARAAAGYGVDLAKPARVAVVRHDGQAGAVREALRDRGFQLMAGRPGEVAVVAADSEELAGRLAGIGAVGLGAPFTGAPDCPRSYREAAQAAEMAARLGRSVLAYQELGLLQMLAAGGDCAPVDEFVDGRLGALIAHDQGRGGELVATLAAYLDAGANQLATAKALGVHVNTLKYRLGRVEEIAGVDLSDADARFHLQLALMTQRSLEALRDNR